MDPTAPKDYTRLPEPVRLEDTITSVDVVVPQDEGDDGFRDQQVAVRYGAG